MHILQVKTAFKIADVKFVPGNTKLNFNYVKKLRDENKQPLPPNILTKNVARVYLIVVENGTSKNRARIGLVKLRIPMPAFYKTPKLEKRE